MNRRDALKEDRTTDSRRSTRDERRRLGLTDLANTKIEEGVRQREEALMRVHFVVERFNLKPGHEKLLWSILKECSGDVTPVADTGVHL